MTLAHSGHWYHSLLYLLPVLLIAGGLWWSGRTEDRDPPRPGDQAGDEPAGD